MNQLRPFRRLAPLALAVAWACSDSDTPGDAGTPLDATAAADAQPRPDATATPDSGVTETDSGSPIDTGVETDAGEVADTGAGPTDTGAGPGDAGVTAPTDPVIHTFSAGGHDRLFGAIFDDQNNLLAVGVTSNGTISPDLESIVVRIRPDGTLDPTFGTNGVFRRNLVAGGTVETARGIVIQSDGRIVVSAAVDVPGATDAREADVALFRLTRTGTVDASFGTNGVAVHDFGPGAVSGNTYLTDAPWGLALADDDALILQGSRKNANRNDSDFMIVKFTERGALDRSFGVGGVFELDVDNANASSRVPTVLADGSILGAGYMTVAGVTTPVVFKVTPGGVLDETFGARGVFTTAVLSSVTETYAIVPQSTGDLVTAGYGREESTATNDFLSLRLSAAGVLDRNYGTNGAAVVDIGGGGFADNCRDLVVLPDDRVVMVGNGRSSASNNEGALVVLTSSGAPDRSFGPNGVRTYDLGGPADAFWDVARAPDGRLGVVGLRGALTGNGNDDAVVLILPAL